MAQYNWDDLRRQAKALENELDNKLVSFGSLSLRSTEFSRVPANKTSNNSHHFVVPGLGDFESGAQNSVNPEQFSQIHAQIGAEIEQLLQRLTVVNDQMSLFVHDVDTGTKGALPEGSMRHSPIPPTNTVSTSSSGPTSLTAGQLTQLHTIKRHREILRDYAQEFRQTKQKIMAREREDLLGSVYRDVSNRDLHGSPEISGGQRGASLHASTTSNSTRLLLDEQEKYHRSSRMMDEHLAAASTIRAALRAQRMALRNASSGLHNLATRFPKIKQLIGKIDWRHQKDSIVLGLVISFCIAFLIIYKLT